jgi:2-keto-4-pentenoate hydratase/2-oxohepta-3-ene-1,7-dioic acid hydratase in catechol pathway
LIVRICRFDEKRIGVVEGEELVDVSEALAEIPPLHWPLPPGDALIAHWDRVKPAIERLAWHGLRRSLASVRLASPVANPSKIIGIARNRRQLDQERTDPEVVGQPRRDGDPVHFFIKANSALAGPADGISLRFPDRRTDPEAELGIIIGKAGSDIAPSQARGHVFGYCIGMDVSLRGMESPSSRKSIDSYGLIGPWMVTADEIADPDRLAYSMSINAREVQSANTANYAFDVATVVSQVSAFMTLYPGDVIMAGTPVGVFDRIDPGDTVSVDFEGIGPMTLAVRRHA